LSRITSALTPTSARTELGNELRFDVDVLARVRDILFEPTAIDGRVVRRSVEGFLRRKLDRAPRRGKGARKRRFLAHCLATAIRYREGLYACYRDPLIAHTSNLIEGANGLTKHHARRVGGRGSTAGGPFESYGELVFPLVAEAKLAGTASMLARATEVPVADYVAARRTLKRLAEPARRYRAAQRRPEALLQEAIALATSGLDP
jgi:hypothetical protein